MRSRVQIRQLFPTDLSNFSLDPGPDKIVKARLVLSRKWEITSLLQNRLVHPVESFAGVWTEAEPPWIWMIMPTRATLRTFLPYKKDHHHQLQLGSSTQKTEQQFHVPEDRIRRKSTEAALVHGGCTGSRSLYVYQVVDDLPSGLKMLP
nr:uncharacterized protein LOC109408599 [Aedes albopictus]